MSMFQVGDIISYNDPLFDDSKHFVTDYFVVSNIVDDMYYHLLPLNNDKYVQPETYLVAWVNDSSKWKKVT